MVGVIVTGSTPLPVAMCVRGAFAVLACLWLVARLPDRPATADARTAFGLRKLGRTFWVNPVRHPDFGWS